jgi:4-amino-4-deoxy-L-arabinose transferase-like glycosyltransferase
MNSNWSLFRTVVVALIAVKLFFLALSPPFMDETYYWMWGQHPALSYYDHPPMVGWTAGLASLLGWSTWSMRVPVLLSLVGDIFLLQLFARHAGGEDWHERFWFLLAMFVTTPLLFMLSGLALPDHLLLVFSLASLYALQRFLRTVGLGSPRWRWLLVGFGAAGLATLSKYTGAFLVAGFLLHLLATPAYRRLLRAPPLYAGVVVYLVLQTPVLLWNIEHRLSSFGFVWSGHVVQGSFNALGGVSGFLLGPVVVLSPFLIALAFGLLRGKGRPEDFARTVFWLSSGCFFVASFFTNILIHWNEIAYFAMLPLLGKNLRPRFVVRAHMVYGTVGALLIVFNYTVLPLTSFIWTYPDPTSAWSYGWSEIATNVRSAAKRESVSFIAATSYTIASPLAFALQEPGVLSLAPAHEAYDDWTDPELYRGQTALIVTDRFFHLPPAIRAQFSSVDQLKSVRIRRFGRQIARYDVYVGRDFNPQRRGNGK